MPADYTILVQGPPHNNTLSQLEHYQQYGPVILSFESDRNQLTVPTMPNVHTCVVAAEALVGYNRQNILRQAATTLEGLICSHTKWTIKLRSDEFYEGLDRVIERHQTAPEKVMTTPIYFRTDAALKYHIGDHFMVGPTSWLRQAFDRIVSACQLFTDDMSDGTQGHKCVAEALITRALLLQRGACLAPECSRQLMAEFFDVIPMRCFDAWSCRVYDWKQKPPGRLYVSDVKTLRKYINDPIGQCVFESMDEL